MHGVEYGYSPSGSSKSTGTIEAANKVLKLVLRKTSPLGQIGEWDTRLSHAVAQTNQRKITYLGYSPSEILLGLPPRHFQPIVTLPANPEVMTNWIKNNEEPQEHRKMVQQFIINRTQLREEALAKSQAQKATMKERYDQSVKPYSFEFGDLVFLHQKKTDKLEPRWRGPFSIAGFGEHGVSYNLQQMNGKVIHGRFHGNHLRLYRPQTGYLANLSEEVELPPIVTLRKQRKSLKQVSDRI